LSRLRVFIVFFCYCVQNSSFFAPGLVVVGISIVSLWRIHFYANEYQTCYFFHDITLYNVNLNLQIHHLCTFKSFHLFISHIANFHLNLRCTFHIYTRINKNARMHSFLHTPFVSASQRFRVHQSKKNMAYLLSISKK